MKRLVPHPFADLLPMMSEPEYEALKLDITKSNQRDPIILLDGKILDGRNRYRVCMELGLEPKFADYKKAWGNPLDYVRSKAQHRHMSESQRACVAVTFGEKMVEDLRNFEGTIAPVVTNTDLGAIFGCSVSYVSQARTLREESPKLFEEAFHDRLPVFRAFRELKRRTKKRALKKLAKDRGVDGGATWSIIDGDMVDILGNKREPEYASRLCFIDPPYNIGIDYGDGANADSLPREQFIELSRAWLGSAQNQLTDDGALFVMTSMEYLGAYEAILRERGLTWRQTIIWVEAFGTYTSGNFSPCCRPILYFTKHAVDRVWHGDQILIPSDRQTKYGDSRANPAGKVPSNVWDDMPRLVGNHADRVPGFPTQIPREITDRIILACSDPGDLVIDGFNGSGTTGVSAVTNGRRYLGVEKVPANAVVARARIAAALASKGAS